MSTLTSIQIVWINQSQGSLSDSDAALIVEALNLQMPQLEQFWTTLAPLTHSLLPAGQDPPSGSETLIKAYFLPSADVAGALGYHDVDPQGDPYIRVFTDTVLQAGGSALSGSLSISACASHEACEEAVDPSCTATAKAPNGDTWALEVGDPVESDSYTITTSNGTPVAVSDFVTPAFFDQQTASGQDASVYDYSKVLTSAFTLAKGGYAIVNDQQVFAEKYPKWRRDDKRSEVSRTYRRLRGSVRG